MLILYSYTILPGRKSWPLKYNIQEAQFTILTTTTPIEIFLVIEGNQHYSLQHFCFQLSLATTKSGNSIMIKFHVLNEQYQLC